MLVSVEIVTLNALEGARFATLGGNAPRPVSFVPEQAESDMNKPSPHRPSSPASLTEADIDNERMGRNRLQGADQVEVRNERQAVPDERGEADGVLESFRKIDKHRRAEAELGKGATKGARSS